MKILLSIVLYSLLMLTPFSAGAVGVLAPVGGDASYSVAERAVESTTKVMVNGDTVFTVSGGPIFIVDLISICISANDATASTMQWQTVPTVGSSATFSGASASLASATAGSSVRLAPTALSTAPVIVTAANGGALSLGTNLGNHITVGAGTIKLVIGVGSTTGTWKHYLRYKPLAPNAMVN